MPNWTIPIAALIAPTVMMTSTAVSARGPRNSRYAIGTIAKSRSCLSSRRLTARSIENAVETSVMPA
jgi:hypothetical protein